jgi:NAD(P)-dependent dehydrogenase (short-subunit alcohol dehydrogenase family)
MASYLITGSSRGLGLALATILSGRSSQQVRKVIASARTKTPALQTLLEKNPDRVAFVALETNKQASVEAAVSEVQKILGPGAGLDVLINNAGISSWTQGGTATM